MAVEYNQHTWGYGEELTPDKLNNIEGGVKANADAINEVNNNLGFGNFCVYPLEGGNDCNEKYNLPIGWGVMIRIIGNALGSVHTGGDTYFIAIFVDIAGIFIGNQVNGAQQIKWNKIV